MILLRQNLYARRDYAGLTKEGKEILAKERKKLADKIREMRKKGESSSTEIAHTLAHDKRYNLISAKGYWGENIARGEKELVEKTAERYDADYLRTKKALQEEYARLYPKPEPRPSESRPSWSSPKRDKVVQLVLEGGGIETMSESEARRRGLLKYRKR